MDSASAVAIIELNDSEIRVARAGEIVLRSPGYAIVGDRRIEVGRAALGKAWLNPRALQNRYWSQLNLDPLPTPTARARHHADLAYAHLLGMHEQAGQPAEAVFAVPGHYTSEQLALLLGLVEASPFTAIGLVDAAVAAAAGAGPGTGACLHAELYLHHTVLTRLQVADDVDRTGVEVAGGVGWAAILDDCAALIAERFIEQSRFDPQHHAETEQMLYDQIPQALRALARREEAAIEIRYHNTSYLVKIPRSDFQELLAPRYRQIARLLPAGYRVLLGDRLAALPGLTESLGAGEIIASDGLFRTCSRQIDRIRSTGSALQFVTRLPALAAPDAAAKSAAKTPDAATPNASAERAGPPVTHVLSGHCAYRLGAGTGRVYFDAATGPVHELREGVHASVEMTDGHLRLQPENGRVVLHNGRVLDRPAEVEPGDTLRFADSATEYRFITVLR